MGTCPRVRLPGGREDGYLAALLREQYSAVTVRKRTQVRYLVLPLGNGHIPVQNWPQPTRRRDPDPTVHGWHCFLYPDQISEQRQKNKVQQKQLAGFRGSPGHITENL